MNNKYFNISDTLYDITEKYKETIDIFVNNGFENLKEESQRKSFGSLVTLEQALKTKKIDISTFENLLNEVIDKNINTTAVDSQGKNDLEDYKLKIQGLLPCPVRVPMLNAFEKFIANKPELKNSINYELKAASMGLDWLKEDLKNGSEKDLSDIFISAGFDLFFEDELMGQYKKSGVFKDITGLKEYNKEFTDLKDPKGEYSMIGVVPAVFLINKEALNGKKVPESWEDLLSEDYANSVSLPVSDFDLFNAILINVYKNFGMDGVRKLARNLHQSLHPAQMVKSYVKPEPPLITVMPYFFTKTINERSPMKYVWPSDGAIISPIFMLTKAKKEDELKEIAEFFSSKEVGEVLSHQGLFPSINPDVKNGTEDKKYMWIGWDYIAENNIGELLKKCEIEFKKVNLGMS
ncbi:ABC transporter substrate-binding protein [Haliovirga abyssi]|uniref:Spermidine/putrescine ABC transporter substrate-binding protein n=1 Tax=Haliovirga abyssi TaxID=2996794 RepID=A0AAU9DFB5_9FUSO|nr:ABC transporter substrate-binding protein [Haliovirga abyssi]BDU51107.1 spermidine/putrescine ABC transporter substrate-binding protein [Haliovirga abyssi]